MLHQRERERERERERSHSPSHANQIAYFPSKTYLIGQLYRNNHLVEPHTVPLRNNICSNILHELGLKSIRNNNYSDSRKYLSIFSRKERVCVCEGSSSIATPSSCLLSLNGSIQYIFDELSFQSATVTVRKSVLEA